MVDPGTAIAAAEAAISIGNGLFGKDDDEGYKPQFLTPEQFDFLPDSLKSQLFTPIGQDFFNIDTSIDSEFSDDIRGVLNQFGPARAEFDTTLAGVRDLRDRFRPGFSEIREARLNAVADARRRGLSNLRESLNRRNILGSSFASDTLTRARREFSRERAQQAARSFKDEIAATLKALDLERNIISNDLQALAAQGQIANTAFATDVRRQAAEGQLEVSQAGLALEAQRNQQDFYTNLQSIANGAQATAAKLAQQSQIGAGRSLAYGLGKLGDIFDDDSGGGGDLADYFIGTGEVQAGTGDRAVPFLNYFN